MDQTKGDPVTVGSVTMSLHTGTHADAPLHFLRDGAGIADVALDVFIGEALVIDCIDANKIETTHMPETASDIPRLLFKTYKTQPECFENDFAYFTPEAATALARLGVKLVGIDTPSVDPFDSKTLEAHKILAEAGIAILENLCLADVSAGRYELIALPLKLDGMDASPVRAILREMD